MEKIRRSTRNAATSYDPQTGNVFAVREDSNQPGSTVNGANVQFKIRGAIFFIAQCEHRR
jgi:hypothetical protein